MTITLTREEAQSVLDALVFATPSGYGPTEVYKDSIVLLQNRLAKETPYEVGQRLYRQGLGISDIPTAVYSDSDIAEAYLGFEAARLSAPEPTLVLWNVKSNRLASPSDDRAQVFAIRKLEWRGLTDEEIMDLCAAQWASHPIDVARIIEAKLKEKNND
jgi:hypothetical protein